MERVRRRRLEDEGHIVSGTSGATAASLKPGNSVLAGLLAGTPHVQRAEPTEAEIKAASERATTSRVSAWVIHSAWELMNYLGRKGTFVYPIGVDSGGQPILAHLIPGQVNDVAMVVGGVHGSEQSGVEVVSKLLAQLAVHKPYYTVVVIPELFPSNVASRKEWEQKLAAKQKDIALAKYKELRNAADDPGRDTPGQVDPNRQFPDLGKAVDFSRPLDATGKRLIEPSNLALLAMIDQFKPSRVVSVHAIKELSRAGVYSDPHPSAATSGQAGQAKEMDDLAIEMARRAKTEGANVVGNERLGKGKLTSLYPGQDPKTSKAQIERENRKGRSFGQWGPSVGIGVITVEVGEQHASDSAVKGPLRGKELEAHATAIREIFLGPPAGGVAPPAGTGGQQQVPIQRAVVQLIADRAGNRAAAGAVHAYRSG